MEVVLLGYYFSGLRPVFSVKHPLSFKRHQWGVDERFGTYLSVAAVTNRLIEVLKTDFLFFLFCFLLSHFLKVATSRGFFFMI